MSKSLHRALRDYAGLLAAVRDRIRQAQSRAILSANAEMIRLYWDVGHMLIRRQRNEGWGAAVIPRLARDLRNELPEIKGFSERNIGYMIRFAREYRPDLISQQPVAKLSRQWRTAIGQQLVARSIRSKRLSQPVAGSSEPMAQLLWQIPWGHHELAGTTKAKAVTKRSKRQTPTGQAKR